MSHCHSQTEDEDNRLGDKDSTRSGVCERDGDGDGDGDEGGGVIADVAADGDGDRETRKAREKTRQTISSTQGADAVISDCISLRTASESGQSGGGTEHDPVAPERSVLVAQPSHIIQQTETDYSGLFIMISSGSADLNDHIQERRVDPTSTPLEPAQAAQPPPIIAKTRSSSTAKSRKQGPCGTHTRVLFPSSVAGSDRRTGGAYRG